ncbi:glycosyltransferase family 4 protein [Leeia sp. TBRC 13508]|uniref:Glycosyltransferase family 4 protein n=1 Tax=Leeia speluncae TaxID=2884804 RepID=A0ABS8D1T7_9NEIS|nr:glycosyltransferase family 4 protein [Leeia speluncae]MCB6182161.1 glycosyltransferase family 4 protein [Leeia speluncae]
MHIAVLTSAHPRFDIRIFIKECKSLVATGHRVTLVVADGLGNTVRDGVDVLDVGKATGRAGRMTKSVYRVYRAAMRLNADVYHFHDPELLVAGLLLRLADKKVVYDVHEDVPRQILSKPWIRPLIRKVISRTFELFENAAVSTFSAVVAATPTIRDRFLPHNAKTVDVNNFPILEELTPAADWSQKQHAVCYIGGITRVRGIMEALAAVADTDATLLLAGAFNESSLEQAARQHSGWQRTDFAGMLDRHGVAQLLSKSKVGLVTLHPIPNYLDALPIKLFEYMAAGIPVISSDFPLWREIVDDAGCGLCVDPLDPQATAEAIRTLLSNDEAAKAMGASGRRAVEGKYQWANEARKLVALYAGFEGAH